jgi:hypothetical protein
MRNGLLERTVVLALVLTCVVVFPVAALMFFALARMDRLKSLKVSVKFSPLPVLSFEADAHDEPKELPPGEVRG